MAAQLERDEVIFLVVSRGLVGRVARRELLHLEGVRVAHGRPDALDGPLRITDCLVDVGLGDTRGYEARGAPVGRVEVARPDTGDGRCRQPGVHGSSALVGGLGMGGEPGEDREEDEPEDSDDREPTRASQTRALPLRR